MTAAAGVSLSLLPDARRSGRKGTDFLDKHHHRNAMVAPGDAECISILGGDVDDDATAAARVLITESSPTLRKRTEKPGARFDSSFWLFLILGCVQVNGWNSMLNSMHPAFAKVFQSPDWTVTVTALHSTTITFLTLALLPFNIVRVGVIGSGVVLSLLTIILYVLVMQHATVSERIERRHLVATVILFVIV